MSADLPGGSTAVWVGRTFVGLAGVLALWTVFLGVTLPEQGVLAHQDVLWVGFDIGLLVGLVSVAWTALRRNRFLPLAAAATATMLLVDAWFDVVGSHGRDDVLQAVVLAVVVELPLSAACWWMALHAQVLIEQRIAARIMRRRGE